MGSLIGSKRPESPTMSPSRAYSSPLRNSGPSAKLEHVAERFSAFYNDLEQEKQNRKIAESSKHQMLHESVVKLEKSLEAEIKRRAESDKQLQAHFENEVRTLQERTSLQLTDIQQAFKGSLEGLSRTVQDLHSIIKEEREQRRSDIEHLATSLVSKVNECVTALEEERIQRMDAHGIALKRFGEDIFRVQEKIDGEKTIREAELAQLRSEIHDALGNRNISDEKFQAVVMEEIANLRSALSMERDERVAEDDEIVQAINDYTRALQDGLRIVNTT